MYLIIVHKYLPFAEYLAFCHPLPCQEGITFLIGHLTAYCKRAEDEQARDVTGELQVHLFFPCEIMFTFRARESSWLCAGEVQCTALFLEGKEEDSIQSLGGRALKELL